MKYKRRFTTGGGTLLRSNGYDGYLFSVEGGAWTELVKVTLDGGAVWNKGIYGEKIVQFSFTVLE